MHAGPAYRTCWQKLQSIFRLYTGYREQQFLHQQHRQSKTCTYHSRIRNENILSMIDCAEYASQDLHARPAGRTCTYFHLTKYGREFQIIILQFLHRRTCMQDLHITFFIIVFCYLFDTDTAGLAGRTCRQDLQQELPLPDQKAPEHQLTRFLPL